MWELLFLNGGDIAHLIEMEGKKWYDKRNYREEWGDARKKKDTAGRL